MTTVSLEARVKKLVGTVQEVQNLLAQQPSSNKDKHGWKWFVGIDADNPHFENAVRLGKEWRDADRPTDEEKL